MKKSFALYTLAGVLVVAAPMIASAQNGTMGNSNSPMSSGSGGSPGSSVNETGSTMAPSDDANQSMSMGTSAAKNYDAKTKHKKKSTGGIGVRPPSQGGAVGPDGGNSTNGASPGAFGH